jgi:hypothetical protein
MDNSEETAGMVTAKTSAQDPVLLATDEFQRHHRPMANHDADIIHVVNLNFPAFCQANMSCISARKHIYCCPVQLKYTCSAAGQ